MSGAYVFAKDENDDYYMIYHPTDVRYERATAEEMESGMEQWTMLNAWAEEATVGFIDENEGLESYDRGNTAVDIYLARAAWQEGVNATLSTTEYGPLELKGVDGTPYAEFVMGCHFWETDAGETPDGEYVALNFPDDGVRLDFFFAPGGRCQHSDPVVPRASKLCRNRFRFTEVSEFGVPLPPVLPHHVFRPG